MWWFSRTEEPPPGLPAPTYAIFKLKEGWFYLRGNPGNVRGERYRDGPFPEREDARWHAWKDAWERGIRDRIDE
jgi:hypothetical protein